MSFIKDIFHPKCNGTCPACNDHLHIDTGSIIGFEKGLIPSPVFFCTNCGYDSEKEQENATEAPK